VKFDFEIGGDRILKFKVLIFSDFKVPAL